MSKRIDDYTELPGFERKTIPTFVKASDGAQGIVEHIVSVFGIRDLQGDRVLPGSFLKTISERAGDIRALDQHRTDSALRVVGRPTAMREISQAELPAELLAQFPEATGGLLVTTQYAMKTDNGRDMFHLVDGGFLPETSIGYDPITAEFVEEEIDGEKVTTRLLKEIRLWEYSNVIWGANPATVTTGTKGGTAQAAFDEEDRAQLIAWIKTASQDERADLWQAYVMREGKRTLDNFANTTDSIVSGILGDSVLPDGALLNQDPPRYEGVDPNAAQQQKSTRRPSECKAVNLADQMNDVVMGFYNSYLDTSDYSYWVLEVWDEYLIVNKEIVGGSSFFRVPYTMFSGNGSTIIAYAAPEQWTKVEHVWIPVESDSEQAAPAPDEQAAIVHADQAGPDDDPPTDSVTLDDIDAMIQHVEKQLSEVE